MISLPIPIFYQNKPKKVVTYICWSLDISISDMEKLYIIPLLLTYIPLNDHNIVFNFTDAPEPLEFWIRMKSALLFFPLFL